MNEKLERRLFQSFAVRRQEDTQDDVIVGVPVIFNQATCMGEFDGVKFYEKIDRHAFDSCDMSDVIFNFNHGGRVLARTRNQTLKLKIGDSQIDMEAYLGGTEEGKKTLEEIRGGYLDKMSFAFDIAEDGLQYDRATHTHTITRIKKLYDVSVVDFPAYENTSIYARSFFSEQLEAEKRKIIEERKKKMILKSKI